MPRDESSALQNRCWLRGATVLVCYRATYGHLRFVSGSVAFGGLRLTLHMLPRKLAPLVPAPVKLQRLGQKITAWRKKNSQRHWNRLYRYRS